ncbi:dihydropteroate synthase [Nocardia sp. NPDC051911]|uniref:dihydropteroate synthase n=1 Tax=Nocardia sp. NPDC051911 TaxID=3154648 RepID=UPI003435371B
MPGLPARDRCLVMGILNVTTDSFSDGGYYSTTERAVAHGLDLARQGADIIDIGGESTRPGANRVPVDLELRRVLPVIRELSATGVCISVDTTRARVADAALAAGAQAVNDVSGGLADPEMARTIAAARMPYFAMHWRGQSATMNRNAVYRDVVQDVMVELGQRMWHLTAAGVDPDLVVLDPGLGFAKTPEHNWHLLTRLSELHGLGRPVLIGASRKSFLSNLLMSSNSVLPARERDAASVAVATMAAAAGAYCVRAHDVRATLQAVLVVKHWFGIDGHDHSGAALASQRTVDRIGVKL